MSNPEEIPKNSEQEATQAPIANDTISPEMNAALHAAKEEDEANQAETDSSNEILPDKDETISKVQEALDNAFKNDPEPRAEEPKGEDVAAMKEQLIRTMAEMENLRKRTDREMSEARKYAVTGFARDLVSVVDNLQLALQNIPEEDRKKDDKLNNLVQGIEMTFNELLRAFEKNGIVRIDPKGEKFNHNHHQAVAQVEDADAEPGSVAQVLQAGYIINDRLLRPAMVTVAKGGDKAESVSTEA